MRTILTRSLALGLFTLTLGTGCAGMSHTDRGLATGGAVGALAGAALARHNPLAGAAIGGAVGAVTGGAIGASEDRAERRMEARVAAQQRQAPTLQEIVTMTGSGVTEDVIVNQIRNSGAVYQLSSQEVVYLQQSGVSPGVIRELQATAYRPVRRAVVVQPVYVEPVPPPVSIGVYGRFR